jgi:hypothetical protein
MKDSKFMGFMFALCAIVGSINLLGYVHRFFDKGDFSDICYEVVELETGRATIVHKCGHRTCKYKGKSGKRSVSDYIKYKNHCYCWCVNEEILDRMSAWNCEMREIVYEWASEYAFDECYDYEEAAFYLDGIRIDKDDYNPYQGGELRYVYSGDGEYRCATRGDELKLREHMFGR